MTTENYSRKVYPYSKRLDNWIKQIAIEQGQYQYYYAYYGDWYHSEYTFSTPKYIVTVHISDDAHVGGEIEVRKWRR